jgi:ribosomal subunit interface protein
MIFEVRWGTIDKSDALQAHASERVEHALRHHADRFTRVDLHLHDDNAGKGGHNDKRIVIEAHPRGGDSLSVEHTGDDFYATVDAACKKLQRAVEHWIDRHRTH